MAEDEDGPGQQKGKFTMGDAPKSPSLLPWDKFTNWLHCACVVTFDLELGQAMEVVYPAHVKLTDKEKTNICYLSFPDSNSGCMGDIQFHFRIRRCPGRQLPLKSHTEYNRDCPTALQTDDGHYYGFVHFRQTKDKNIRRGYFQKSVVLISKLPFVNLFNELVANIALEYFDNGEPCLEAACHDIDQWSPPVPGEVLNLPLLGNVIQIRIPTRDDKLIGNQQSRTSDLPLMPANYVLPTLHEVDLFSPFVSVIHHIQMLWELVITGEPLVVMASEPTVTTKAVQALVSMIWPLKYATDYRPYFTIHDSEFKEYTSKTQSAPSVILGVTNPFFAKTLQHWPHIIRIGEMTTAPTKNFNKLKKTGNLKTLDSKPGVYTQYKPFLSKDKTIIKKLSKGQEPHSQRPIEAQNAMLRRHLLELTQSFMIPLERYVASLMPLQRNISPHKGPPRLRNFDPDEFMKTLENSGPQLTSGLKGDWTGLYRKFFQSANFEHWLKVRTNEVNCKLEALHFEALCNADLISWVKDKQEVEVVDLVLRLREKLAGASCKEIPISADLQNRLQSHHDKVIASLPDDLQTVLRSS